MKRILAVMSAALTALSVLSGFGDTVNLADLIDNALLTDGTVVTGTLGCNVKISIAAGATVTLDNAVIIGENLIDCEWAGITCEGDATIMLAAGTTNTVMGFYTKCPGIYVPAGCTLTIDGEGDLDASSYGLSAGIGGGWDLPCGNIVICNGTITAESGGYSAAGIGGGCGSSCGDITISGGTVTATAGSFAAGIGAGYNFASCGDITISGGTVNGIGGQFGAGIGSGRYGVNCGDITISGGTVTAVGGQYSAGIGCGSDGSNCGNIAISGGEVVAIGSESAAGIGGGYAGCNCGDITISGGTVTAVGGANGAGIGGGVYLNSCGDITITKGVAMVTAVKGDEALNTIGPSIGGSCGTVEIGGKTGEIAESPFVYIPPAVVKLNTGYSEIEVEVPRGQAYGEDGIAMMTEAAQANATRRGQTVTGWTNAEGDEVNAETVAAQGDTLFAVMADENPLVPETKGDGAIISSKEQTYDCYILDGKGKAAGTATVIVGKRDNRGLSKVKAQVKLVGESRTYMFNPTETKWVLGSKGKATISLAGPTVGMELDHAIGAMTIDIGTEGVRGEWGDWVIFGVRRLRKENAALYKSWKCDKTIAIADANGAYSTFSVSVSKNGSVHVKGCMTDGSSMSASTQLMVSEDGKEACLLAKGTKKVPVGFVLWLGKDDAGNVVATGIESIAGEALSGGKAAVGDFGVGGEKLTFGIDGVVSLELEWNGKSFKPVEKDCSIKVEYKKNNGTFKGVYKMDVLNSKGRPKKKGIEFKGMFVNGVGYGVTTDKEYFGMPVVITPNPEE